MLKNGDKKKSSRSLKDKSVSYSDFHVAQNVYKVRSKMMTEKEEGNITGDRRKTRNELLSFRKNKIRLTEKALTSMTSYSSLPTSEKPCINTTTINGTTNSYDDEIENTKEGYLSKYSVGRGSFLNNWRRRWFKVDHNGLNYSKNKSTVPSTKTFIPFTVCTKPELTLAHVYLLGNVTTALHPKASKEDNFYFGIRFEENQKPYILLLRAKSAIEREGWVRFLAQFLHWGVQYNGGVPSHPPTFSWLNNPKDSDRLSYKSRRKLRKTILAWEEGYQKYRHQGTKVLCHFKCRPYMECEIVTTFLSQFDETTRIEFSDGTMSMLSSSEEEDDEEDEEDEEEDDD